MSGNLLLGVARTDITPEVGCHLYGYSPNVISESVHDRLTATAFYFKSGDTDALMLSLAVCLINTELSYELCAMIEERFGVKSGNCIIHCIHNHSGPNISGDVGWGDIDRKYYNDIFLPNVMQAIEEAKKAPVAVKMGIAVGDSYIGINRRQLTKENKVILGQNPWGVFDPQMTVMSFVDCSGKPVANIVHYGMHGTCAGKNREISRDFAGVMVDELERQSGAVTAFFNGAEGDVGPRLTNGLTMGICDISFAERHGALAAADAVAIYKKIATYHDAPLSVLVSQVDIPLDRRIDYETAKAGYEEYKEYTENVRAKTASYYKTQLELYENGYVDKEYRTMPQTIVRIGDVAFVSFAYELFSEIAMRIAVEKKVPYTLSLSNTNGNEGYFVTEDQICRGGYEIEMFKTGYIQPYANNADWHLVNQTLKNLDKLNGDN